MTKEDIDATEAPLIDHLIELRTRLIYCVIGIVLAFAVSFAFSTTILNYLLLPFKWGTDKDVTLISTHLLGVFIVKLKIVIGEFQEPYGVFDANENWLGDVNSKE